MLPGPVLPSFNTPSPPAHIVTTTPGFTATSLQLWNEDSYHDGPFCADDDGDRNQSMISAVTLDPYLHFVSKHVTTSKSPITPTVSSNNNRRNEHGSHTEPYITQSFIRDVVTTTRYEL
jgi:hypothetical protein